MFPPINSQVKQQKSVLNQPKGLEGIKRSGMRGSDQSRGGLLFGPLSQQEEKKKPVTLTCAQKVLDNGSECCEKDCIPVKNSDNRRHQMPYEQSHIQKISAVDSQRILQDQERS